MPREQWKRALLADEPTVSVEEKLEFSVAEILAFDEDQLAQFIAEMSCRHVEMS